MVTERLLLHVMMKTGWDKHSCLLYFVEIDLKGTATKHGNNDGHSLAMNKVQILRALTAMAALAAGKFEA